MSKETPKINYKVFKAYVRFIYCGLYNRKNYVINRENLPEEGPLMIVSDHQNSLNDALALLMAVGRRGTRKVRAITRADAFRPLTEKLFRWIGLMPAFRMNYDGADTLSNNSYSFGEAADELVNDGTVIIYPEAGHQDKRWLGTFSFGYLRILFDAAEKTGFEKEFYIMPSCNHYEDYQEVRTDVMIKFGQPIALSPFYELYKTKPRTAQRQVNELVREQVSNLMLNITDLENYEAIDFLRNTYGRRFARKNRLDPDILPKKLKADKLLFEELSEKKQEKEAVVNSIYDDAQYLAESYETLGISDSSFDRNPPFSVLLLKALLLLLLLPVYVAALLPLSLIVFAPKLINRKIKDQMLHGTIRVTLSALVTLPLTCILILCIAWPLSGSFLFALACILSLPLLYFIVVYYHKAAKRFNKEIRFHVFKGKDILRNLQKTRTQLHKEIDKLLL